MKQQGVVKFNIYATILFYTKIRAFVKSCFLIWSSPLVQGSTNMGGLSATHLNSESDKRTRGHNYI